MNFLIYVVPGLVFTSVFLQITINVHTYALKVAIIEKGCLMRANLFQNMKNTDAKNRKIKKKKSREGEVGYDLGVVSMKTL